MNIQEIKTGDDLMRFVTEATDVVREHNWGDKLVHPYPNCPMRIQTILNDCNDYMRYTDCSKEVVLMLANGLRKILNAWTQQESEYIPVVIKETGKVLRIPPWMVEDKDIRARIEFA